MVYLTLFIVVFFAGIKNVKVHDWRPIGVLLLVKIGVKEGFWKFKRASVHVNHYLNFTKRGFTTGSLQKFAAWAHQFDLGSAERLA